MSSPRPSTEECLAAVGIARSRHAEATAAVRPQPAQKPRTRSFRGTVDGRPVLVTIHDPEGYGEIAVRDAGRWGAPVELFEEA